MKENIPSELYGETLPVSNEAKEIHQKIVSLLTILEQKGYSSVLKSDFKKSYFEILNLFDLYQKLVLQNSSVKCTCQRKCRSCCFHWVEDVNSFEAELIADYIRTTQSSQIPTIVNRCLEDQKELERLFTFVQSSMSNRAESDDEIDEVDLLLSVFYQAKRPCPLLDSEGSCSIYPVRPLTCRVYMSFSDPVLCDPAYINDEIVPTYLLNLEEEANDILDRLHFKYQRFEGDTGLRSLLIKYL